MGAEDWWVSRCRRLEALTQVLVQANGTPEPAAAPSTSIVASAGAPAGGPATAPAAAPAGADSSAAVAYGASTFHVDLAASPGISTNSSGLVMFFLSPMESR